MTIAFVGASLTLTGFSMSLRESEPLSLWRRSQWWLMGIGLGVVYGSLVVPLP